MHAFPLHWRQTLRRKAASAGLALLVVFLAGGCASINHLREAQDAFNQASAAENAQRFGAPPQDAVAGFGAVRSGYASALLSLDKLESTDEKSLREDGLWGTALTLRALCHWRLGQFQAALSTAAEAQRTSAEQVYPRDRAILAALPGLIKTDQAYARIMAQPAGANASALREVGELLTGPSGAIADIQAARALTDANHPVQVYLIQAQLAAYRNHLVARGRFIVPPVELTDEPERRAANAQLAELDRLLKLVNPGPSGVELVNTWVRLCALDIP